MQNASSSSRTLDRRWQVDIWLDTGATKAHDVYDAFYEGL